jgi:hypothetical protein
VKIERIEAIPYSIPYVKPLKFASGEVADSHMLGFQPAQQLLDEALNFREKYGINTFKLKSGAFRWPWTSRPATSSGQDCTHRPSRRRAAGPTSGASSASTPTTQFSTSRTTTSSTIFYKACRFLRT